MSVNDVRNKLEKLFNTYPNDLRLIRSARDVDKVDIMNADVNGPYDNGDIEAIETIERALSAGKQVAVQAAGPKQILVLTSKAGKKLFDTIRDPKLTASSEIMNQLEAMHKRYRDSNGKNLLMGGLDSYIYPERFAELARKYNFAKYKSFGIDDESLLDEVRHYLENNKMVVIAAWGKEERVDMYLEPSYSGSNKASKGGGCFIATAVYGSPIAPEVIVFRQFRDKVLLTSKLGTGFVKCYYIVSPPLALLISKHKSLGALTRCFLLEPILYLIKKGR